jgi:hypothetical protein
LSLWFEEVAVVWADPLGKSEAEGAG